MSEETKKDLQRQIDEEENTITACNARAADLRKALSLIKDKPEPRLGDYVDFYGKPRLIAKNSDGEFAGHEESGQQSGTADCPGYKLLGNIFDDLNAAGPGGILLPLTKDEALDFMDHRRGDLYCFGPNFDSLKTRIEAKVK